MASQKPPRPPLVELRAQAEARLAQAPEPAPGRLSVEVSTRLVHKLRVHQFELESQNEELRRTQLELTMARERYFDLYDLAPVGYLTLDEKGRIRESNMTGARMLRMVRSALPRRLLSGFVAPEDVGLYQRQRALLLESGGPAAWEMSLVRKDGTRQWTRAECTLSEADGRRSIRCVLSDVSAHKALEEQLRDKATKLEAALGDLRVLSALLRSCVSCKRIRDEHGAWMEPEEYLRAHSNTEFTHGICEACEARRAGAEPPRRPGV